MNLKKFHCRLGRLTVKTSMSAPETMAKETATTHALILILGSFRCSSAAGFHLDADRLTCHDINECQANNGNCLQKCINTQGDHSCFCFEGFVSLVLILFFFSCIFLFLPGYLWHSMTSANPSHTEFISDAQNANCFFFGGWAFFLSLSFLLFGFSSIVLYFFLFLFCIVLFFSLRASRTCIKFDCTKWKMVSLSLSLLYSLVLTFSLLSINECFGEIN